MKMYVFIVAALFVNIGGILLLRWLITRKRGK